MCAIFGLVDLSEPVDPAVVVRRRDSMRHRGPDDAGLWISPNRRVALAHRRLSILDLSSAGRQPMLSDDGRYAIVLNGEIYNYKELRGDLEGRGFRFRSTGDTEVLLAAYQAWGEGCLDRLLGMFAFAVYDAGDADQPASILLARDRVGKKPLYYQNGEKGFQFASELKALEHTGAIDLDALNCYLTLGYVPGDQCLAAGVRKLPPAHAARFDLTANTLRVWRYWSLPAQDGIVRNIGELKEEAEVLLLQAVGTRLQADVPVGVFLSGGFDSALVTAYAAKAAPNPIHTFTVRMDGSSLDESRQALRIARHFGTDHHELRVDALSLKILEELLVLVDEPIGDSSVLPSFLVSRLARKHITVALGGDGGDEVFGGYNDYPTALNDERRIGWIPESVLAGVAAAAGVLPAGVRGRGKLLSWRGGAFRQMAWGTPYFDLRLRERILQPEALATLGQLDAPERWLESLMVGRDPVDRMTRTHFNSILPDDFLVKVDRASMANGLEVRCPYLDSRLVEFAFAKLPSDLKVRDGVTRRLQRMLAEDALPPGLDFSRKQGFSIPFDDWLRADSCQWLRSRLETLPDVIRRDAVDCLIRGEMAGRANGSRLFNLLMLATASENMDWT